jgi:hypothetical protein
MVSASSPRHVAGFDGLAPCVSIRRPLPWAQLAGADNLVNPVEAQQRIDEVVLAPNHGPETGVERNYVAAAQGCELTSSRVPQRQ